MGSNQLGGRLQNNPQQKYIEKLHFKNLQSEHLDGKQMDVIVVDVSFISVTLAFLHLLVALVKPLYDYYRLIEFVIRCVVLNVKATKK